jgi:hypothetical protein
LITSQLIIDYFVKDYSTNALNVDLYAFTVETNHIRKYLVSDAENSHTSLMLDEYQITPNPVATYIGYRYIAFIKPSKDIEIVCGACVFNGGKFGYVTTIFSSSYEMSESIDYNAFQMVQRDTYAELLVYSTHVGSLPNTF